MWISYRTVRDIHTDATAPMLLERSPLSSLEHGQRAVLELVDRIHVEQDRTIVRHLGLGLCC